jgi:O-acetyl-ADP-ribose deacetylase (regulator of RNase III)
MITETHGDLLKADADALVNPVNCRGVMGAGLAKQFRQAYPAVFEVYRRLCQARALMPGSMLVCPTGHERPRWIVHFPTKDHWREPSDIADIEQGLDSLREEIADHGITSIAVPALGCGLGGLDWGDVRPLIGAYLGDLEGVQVLVYPPQPQ